MTPILLGLLTAACWGGSDFAARFTGRALGPLVALAGMVAAGFVGLVAWMAASDHGLPNPAAMTRWDLLNGGAIALCMLLFYEALRRGPIALVVPLLGAYPAWSLLFAVAAGARPTVLAWAGMVATMGGVWLVAAAEAGSPAAALAPAERRRVVALSLSAGFVFAIALIFARSATAVHGALGAAFHARVATLLILAALLLLRRQCPRLSARWWAVLAGQGGLDALGYIALYAVRGEVEAAEAAVVSSVFGVVPILLARVFLGERVNPRQWGGMALVFGGVVVLGGTE